MALESYHAPENPASQPETAESADRYAGALARIRGAQEHARQSANRAHGGPPISPTLEQLTQGLRNDADQHAPEFLGAPTTMAELAQRHPGVRVDFVPRGQTGVTQVHEEGVDAGPTALGVFTGGFAGEARSAVIDSAQEHYNVRYDALVTLRLNGHDMPLAPLDIGSFDPANPADVSRVVQGIDEHIAQAEGGLTALSSTGRSNQQPDTPPPSPLPTPGPVGPKTQPTPPLDRERPNRPDVANAARQSVRESNATSASSSQA